MSTPSAEPNTELTVEPVSEMAQPAAPNGPNPQSFKCEKCGAAFSDESSAAAHIQICKGPEGLPEEPAAS